MTTTAALILAAGSSSRMGNDQHKLLLPLGERPVIAHVITAALEAQTRPVIVVLGHQEQQVRARLAAYGDHPELIMVENPDYKQGMSTSLRVGLETLLTRDTVAEETGGHSENVIILLGDQPFVSAEGINRLIATKQGSKKRIVVPLYQGRRGNPVLFDLSLASELLAVTGDEGGRSVIARHVDEVVAVEMGDTMASYDVDTWDAYQQALELWQRRQENQDEGK